MTTSPTYGPVDPLATTPRYTSLELVKTQLGITDLTWDVQITTAIVALEVMMDIYMNRSFPDTGTDPEIDGIPEQVKQAALLGSLEVFKLGDAPGGVAGSDDGGFVGSWEFGGNQTTQAFNSVKPLLRGFRAPDWAGLA